MFFSSFVFQLQLKILWRLYKWNGKERKIYDFFTWCNKLTLQKCNAPFQTQGMKSFLASAMFRSEGVFTTQRESPWTWKAVSLQNVKQRVTLQNFISPAKKWKIDHKNVIHSKSKQLHVNVA